MTVIDLILMTRRVGVLCIALMIAAAAAQAGVVYQLSGSGDSAGYSFQYTAPDFISGSTTVLVAGLDSCTMSWQQCVYVSFGPGPFETSISMQGTVGDMPFYFDPGVLSAVGEYNTITKNSAHLSVTQTGSAAVPEPASIILVAGGLSAIWYGRRRRQP